MKLTTGANGQKEDTASSQAFQVVRAVLIELRLSCPQAVGGRWVTVADSDLLIVVTRYS